LEKRDRQELLAPRVLRVLLERLGLRVHKVLLVQLVLKGKPGHWVTREFLGTLGLKVEPVLLEKLANLEQQGLLV